MKRVCGGCQSFIKINWNDNRHYRKILHSRNGMCLATDYNTNDNNPACKRYKKKKYVRKDIEVKK